MAGNSNSGRSKGSKTKWSREVKDAVLDVFEDIGGRTEFALWAAANRTEFYTKIYNKLLPKDINLSASEETLEDMLHKVWEIERARVGEGSKDGSDHESTARTLQ